jgi:hypothetical protein
VEKVGQNSAISGKLTPELQHIKQLPLEATGIFAGRSQELELHSYLTTRLLTLIIGENAICILQRIKGNILVRFEPTNLRIVYLKNYLRKLKYFYLNSWVKQ